MADPLASIGKGIVHINLRLNRVIELLDRPETGETGANECGEQEILFDLLDALGQALERPAPPRRRSWLVRLASSEMPDEGLRAGLVVARERAIEHLRRRGSEGARPTGASILSFTRRSSGSLLRPARAGSQG